RGRAGQRTTPRRRAHPPPEPRARLWAARGGHAAAPEADGLTRWSWLRRSSSDVERGRAAACARIEANAGRPRLTLGTVCVFGARGTSDRSARAPPAGTAPQRGADV